MGQLFGSAISRMVAAAEILVRLYDDFFAPDSEESDVFYMYFIIAFSAAIIFPLSLMKNMSSFRFTSLFSVICSCFLTMVLFAEYFILCDEQSESTCFWKTAQFENVFAESNYSLLASFSLRITVIYVSSPKKYTKFIKKR